ncbi:exonuclease subunit SbcD [Fibrobacter sp. UWB11]|uniref:exonuclease subunit SbcD n=1 Tax=Fibrobacter sp. UWB11 TaxID=1896202 RepID=UPI0009291CD3|nr:exonuclease subunit SbcD [Fibrobacter sp. UWB11]SIO40231.1 Exodeoxyribonuclease I subunit D [Fibrobacter sp. UWB11]
MKFIHTADWHLGNTMHDIDRTRETGAFLEWLKAEIETIGAQALVIAGDIFDVVNPSNIAKTQYYKFLASLLTTKCSNVIVVGGNHDSGTLLDAPAGILDALNIRVIGSINNRKVDDLVIELKDGEGHVIGICCAVPFMRNLELEQFYKGASSDEDLLKRLYADVYSHAVELRGNRNIPIIATGHLYAANLSGRDAEVAGENEVIPETSVDDGVREVVGTLGNVDVTTFPSELDYVALGHIHYTSMVAKNPKVRYSGSPFVMGFDEANCKRYVLTVDVAQGMVPVVEKIEVPKAVRFEQFKGDIETLKLKLRNLEKELVAKPMETYVDLLLTSGDFVSLNDALEAEESGKHFVVKRHRISRDVLRGVKGFDDCVESTKQYTKEDYFRMLIATNLQENDESEEVKNQYDKFISLFNEAVSKAHEA